MKRDDRLFSRMKLVFFFLAILFSLKNEKLVIVLGGATKDTLLPGQTLALGQTLVSKNGVFQLGFFNYSVMNYLMGIWFVSSSVYDDDSTVWIANQYSPMEDPVLNLSKNGDLVLIDRHKSEFSNSQFIIWSSSETVSSNLVLLDTGNLVLLDRKNPTTKFWQSFDHPTDTWLSGAGLGYNLSITYKDASVDPDPSFYFEIDSTISRRFIIRQILSHVTYSGVFPDLIGIRENGDNATNFYVTIENPHFYVKLYPWKIKIFQWVNESNNSVLVLLWSAPGSRCDFKLLCGPNGLCLNPHLDFGGPLCTCPFGFQPHSPANWNNGYYNDGCIRKVNLDCPITDSSYYLDSFYSIDNITRFPDNSQSWAKNTEAECESSCLSTCSCSAYSYTYNNCSLWFGELINTNIRSDGMWGDVMNIRIRNIVNKHKDKTSRRIHRIIIMLILVVVVVISAIGLIIFYLYKREGLLNPSKVDNILVLYSYAQIKSITAKFCKKLGEGGFGSVFKGKFPDSGELVAVKILKTAHYEEKQFRSEIQTIGVIQHVNLIRLLGFCAEGTKRLLVYEYMPNGSLDSHLFPNNFVFLNWNTRYQIGLGIARGLAYLHEGCRDCIIHCDIKPENILLDEKFRPKIADFGMAKLLGRDFSRALTTMRGTIGYLAPEWISGQPITQKADVYSFGMMLFEIISGRRNIEKIKNRECTYFPLYAAIRVNQGEVLCLLDERLKGNNNIEELDKACKVACWCIQDLEDDRLSMKQVVQMLEGFLKIEMPPVPRYFQNLVDIESDSI